MLSTDAGKLIALVCLVTLSHPILAQGGWRATGTRGAAEDYVHVRRGESLAHLLAALGVSRGDERTPDGIQARRTALPYFTEVKGIAVPIERGLREDAADSGVPPRVISAVADIFGWDIDLEDDLRPGDEFRVLYENIRQAGEGRAEPGKVLGAEILTNGRPTTALFFEDADGRGGYYRPSGAPVPAGGRAACIP